MGAMRIQGAAGYRGFGALGIWGLMGEQGRAVQGIRGASLQWGGGCWGPPVPGAHHHTQRILAGLQHTRQPRRQLLEGRAVGEGEEQKDGVRLLPACLEEERRPSPISAPRIPPPLTPRLPPTHGQEVLEFPQGTLPAVPETQLEEHGALGAQRHGGPEQRAHLDACRAAMGHGGEELTALWDVTHPTDPPRPRGPHHTVTLSIP